MLANTIGISGDLLVIIAFFLLQINRVKSNDLSYLLLNILGSCGVLFSLVYHWNSPAFIIEGAWVAISAYGIYNYFRDKNIKSST
ncbi:hypothetical protein [Francisella sp. 19X1-34]|uniref:CBU_0592 family membrane protein n=1 Tax=Francisella sp. 19X1-34 TaxID=3087177 RepID=UPI002E3387A2|nr:hypothetical protein [Francisella sp. 19X1-34]MED7787847.1 hypothetical protein [Francisella sp. 19X1-34]